MIFRARDKYFDLSEKPLIMGILNITPDSFSDGGKFNTTENALSQCEKMISEGADIIDIGGESSRPGSIRISDEEELERILPVIKAIKSKFDICLSVDTYKHKVAETVLANGVDMINYIKAAEPDTGLFGTVAKYNAGVCLMHMKGTPENMQKDTEYGDIISEILQLLEASASSAVSCGIPKESILIDPGLGFGKDLKGNMKIIRDLSTFKKTGCGILIGTSRKSFIGNILSAGVSDRLSGTVASNVVALMKGAQVFRVHDVKDNRQALDLAYKILNPQKVK